MVYLLHFDTNFKRAKHYLGSTDNLEERLKDHRKGSGAKLMRAVSEAGIGFQLVRTWEDGKKEERNLKNALRLCPICKARTNKGE